MMDFMSYIKIDKSFKVLILILFLVVAANAACTFPSSLRGDWKRTEDSELFTFTSNTVSGFGFQYFANTFDQFDCYLKSGEKYILSHDFSTNGGDQLRLLICWDLDRVSTGAYQLKQLSSDHDVSVISPNAPGHLLSQSALVNTTYVCDLDDDTVFATTLVKDGATIAQIAEQCPSILFATFTYSECSGSSLDFCTDRQTAVVDYTSCPTILNSVGGYLSCMGYTENGSFIYVNLYRHDAGNDVTCLKVKENGNNVDATFYSGDCTTASGAGTDLTLSPTVTCPPDSGGGASNAGLIGGTVTAVAAVSAVVLVGGIYVYKKKKGVGKVHDSEKNLTLVSENTVTSVTMSDAPVATVEKSDLVTNGAPPSTLNGDLSILDSPMKVHHLPPLPNIEPTGQPMRA